MKREWNLPPLKAGDASPFVIFFGACAGDNIRISI